MAERLTTLKLGFRKLANIDSLKVWLRHNLVPSLSPKIKAVKYYAKSGVTIFSSCPILPDFVTLLKYFFPGLWMKYEESHGC